MLPNYGGDPNAQQASWELRLSHWTGELPVLTIDTDWAWHQWDHLYGTFTYAGQPVYGFKSTPGGNPLDTFGRNIYVDTFDSAYGDGWKRENSFLAHSGTGVFCYSFNPHGSHPTGKGDEVSRHGRGARRHAGCDVAGRRTRRVRQVARPAGERRDRATRRQGVPRELGRALG